MIHNLITNNVKVISTGYVENKIILDDGEEMLPAGYYFELEIDGEDFVVPVDEKAYRTIHNAIIIAGDIAPADDLSFVS